MGCPLIQQNQTLTAQDECLWPLIWDVSSRTASLKEKLFTPRSWARYNSYGRKMHLEPDLRPFTGFNSRLIKSPKFGKCCEEKKDKGQELEAGLGDSFLFLAAREI